MDEIELTPEERMTFQDLPREAEPPRMLEERVVRSLREEGLLMPGKPVEAGPRAAQSQGWTGLWKGVAAAAAAVILFGSGMILGQGVGSRSTAQTFLQVREQDAAQLALTIQEAGSAYDAALAALGELESDGGVGDQPHSFSPGSDLQQGREVALGALFAAANELARMDPGDADVLRVLQILDARRARDEEGPAGERNTVWF